MEGMIIIGAGECGVRAAFALREHFLPFLPPSLELVDIAAVVIVKVWGEDCVYAQKGIS